MIEKPREYVPTSALNVYERREIVRAGFAELQPSYKNSLDCVRRGKRRTREVDQRSQLNACERDLTDTLRLISRRAKEAYYGDLLELNTGIMEVLDERELKVLRLSRYKSLREIASNIGLSHETVSNVLKGASAKIHKLRCRQKNPIMWLLNDSQAALWELLQAGTSCSDASEVLAISADEGMQLEAQIRIAQMVQSKVEPLNTEMLAILSIDQRLIYILNQAKYRNCEIAKVLNKSKPTVEKQLNRIRKKHQTHDKPLDT